MDAISKAISQTLQGWSTVLEPPVAPVRGIGFWSWFCNIESIYNAVRVYYLTIIIVCLLLYVALNEWNKRREGKGGLALRYRTRSTQEISVMISQAETVRTMHIKTRHSRTLIIVAETGRIRPIRHRSPAMQINWQL